MGQDYSYSQPSSSEEYDFGFGCLLQTEADGFPDEAERSYNIEEPVQYPPQPECDDGIPRTCYYGAEPVVATSYTSKDPRRRYFTCENVNDGDCHVWKWFDVAVMEELNDIQRQVRLVREQGYVTEQKLMKVVKTVSESAKKKSGVTKGFVLGVCALGTLLGFIGIVVVAAAWFSTKSLV